MNMALFYIFCHKGYQKSTKNWVLFCFGISISIHYTWYFYTFTNVSLRFLTWEICGNVMSSFIFPTNMIRIEFWVIKFIQSVHIITLFLCYPGCQHGYRKKGLFNVWFFFMLCKYTLKEPIKRQRMS